MATSDGELIKRPKFFEVLARKLKLLQRRLKHKKKGSNNKAKLAKKIARVHEQIHDTHVSKGLSIRVHECPECGYRTDRDVAAAQVIRSRGVSAVGQTVAQIACGRDASGTDSVSLGGTARNRNFQEAILGSPLIANHKQRITNH